MIRYFIYFPAHLLGIILVFVAIGAFARLAPRQGSEAPPKSVRRGWQSVHGVGLFLILLGGFGLMKVIGIEHASLYPNWLLAKFAIWVLLCFASLLIYRLPAFTPWLIAAFSALALFSATAGKFKQAIVPDRALASSSSTTE